jgi:hypothetical protein
VEPSDWVAVLSADDGLRLQSGAPTDTIEESESALDATFPLALRNLYRASDGVWDEPGRWFLIWPLVAVLERNRLAWDAEAPARGEWIGFGDDGTGNPFCFRRGGDDDVYYWSSVDQAATRLASDPVAFWQAWVADSLPTH